MAQYYSINTGSFTGDITINETLTGTDGPDSLSATLDFDEDIYWSPMGVTSGSLLIGGSGDDIIIGGPGADVIIGGPGDDTMSGGTDLDLTGNTYVFNPGDGNDIITDFADGFDSLIYEGFSESELDAIVESATLNGDRKIIFGDESTVTLPGVFGVKVEHLVESEAYIAWLRTTQEPGTFKFFIDPGGNTHYDTHTRSNYISEIPTTSQYNWIRYVTAEIQSEVNIKFEEVFSASQADIPFIVTSAEFGESSFSSSGGAGQDDKTFAQSNPKLNISNASGDDWDQIFSHELGHLMGLEHPWDQKNGDTDIPVLNGEKIGPQSVSTDRTVTSYRTWPDGTIHDYYRPLDIKALQTIWGDPNAPFTVTGTQVTFGQNGPAIYLQSDGSYNILSATDATAFLIVKDTKGNAWSSATPIGVEATSTGYNLITETVGKKGSSYLEYTVSSEGVVSKKGTNISVTNFVSAEVKYNIDFTGDGIIGESNVIIGELGDNTYEYDGGEGFDVVRESGGFDTIYFGPNYSTAGWGPLYRDNDNLVFQYANGLGGFTVEDHFSDPSKSIELFEFATSGYAVLVRNSDDVINDPIYGETIIGTSQDDNLMGYVGYHNAWDEFYGYHGNDIIDNRSGGASWIEGGSGDDHIYGGDYGDTIYGDTMYASAIHYAPGNDVIMGGGGNDWISGGGGNDIISGDAGDDILTGGNGSDIFKFSLALPFGNDQILDFSKEEDKLKFYNEADLEVNISLLEQSFAGNGNLVMTASDGSTLELFGVYTYII
ncbi:MAG: hypothetical protein VYE27_03240 [Pseudomonadota bacterium]|nr:hypothetical protein [Pseudomonadota bacterium]